MKKILFISGLLCFLTVSTASAHSTVAPSNAGTSMYVDFSLSVPTEKDNPTVGVRLSIPEGLERITPWAIPGWQIEETKDDADNVTEIRWNGGSIPPGQKQVFRFTGRTPQSGGTLVWKVYQTYQSGEVVAWDRDPTAIPEDGAKVDNPFSVTVISDQTAADSGDSDSKNLPLILSIAALAIAIIALAKSSRFRYN